MSTMNLWRTALVALTIAVPAVLSRSLEAHGSRKPSGPVPWAIDQKPMPQGTALETLLPRTVGEFTRGDLPAKAALKSDEDLLVTYTAEHGSIEVGISRPDSVKDAQDAIDVTRDEARRTGIDLRRERRSMGTDPSYFTVADFASWNRGRYFFFAKASSPAVLDRFMRAFPY